MSDSKSPQISRTLPRIQTDLNYVVIRVVSILLLIFIYSSPFINPLEIVSSVRTTTGATVIFLFYAHFTPWEFFTSVLSDGHSLEFEWQSPHVTRTLLIILAVLNNAAVWMVSTRAPKSKYSYPFYSPFATVLNSPVMISIIVTFMFHSFFFKFSSKVEVLILFSLSFSFILWSAGTAK